MLKDRAIIFGVAGLTAVATAGWMRQPQSVTPAPPALSSFVAPDQAALDTALPVTSIGAAVPVNSSVYRAPVQIAHRQPARVSSNRARYAEPELRQRRVYDDRRADNIRSRDTVVEKRSTGKSVAIIGGSAAAGAAIGGLAGGGKGAAIGAVSGGAAGAVYDRMTHKKRVPASEADNYGYADRNRSRDYDYDDRDDRRNERSTGERVAIIGGGAAAGAAVGGLAGGGKGAAIGALGGGAAGYVYDRMTKNK